MKQLSTILTITPKHHEILTLLYTYRFLNRNQLQLFLHHKHFNRTIIWLNQLTEHNYIRRYYDAKKVTQPAVYSLGNKGRQYLLQHQDEHIEPSVLDRVWKEKSYSLQFRAHCLLVADISLSLKSLTAATKATLQFETKTDLHGRENLILPLPDTLFSIIEQNGDARNYFLDIFDELPPRMLLRRRIRQYMEYFENDEWQDIFKGSFPSIILVCPDERSKKYLYRHIQKQLDEGLELVFYLTTWELVRTQGMRAESLQEVTAEA